MLKTTGIIISAILLVQGCKSSSVKQPVSDNVTSTPSGATVYANGLMLGKTPLKHDLYDAFPAGWKNSMYQAQGVLAVKLDGCEEYTLKINDYILSKPIHTDLKCSEISKTKKIAPTVIPHNVTQKRLEELDTLYKKSIITKDEYNSTRQRILNEL